MPLPQPLPGLVIQYGYLWSHEHDRGRENARYPRPCAIVVARRLNARGETEVVVAPFTHQMPDAHRRHVELPRAVQRALRLPKRTWVILDDVNVFAWPGTDLERNPEGDWDWGALPAGLLRQLQAGLLEAIRADELAQIRRG